MLVDVYYNIRKHLFSIRSRGGVGAEHRKGKVISHWNHVMVRDADFVVSAAGRERVRREGRKNVHAYVRGELVLDNQTQAKATPLAWGLGWPEVRYNPYRDEHFMVKITNDSSWLLILKARRVILVVGGAGPLMYADPNGIEVGQ